MIEDSEAWQAKQCAENVGKYLSDVKCEPVLRVSKKDDLFHLRQEFDERQRYVARQKREEEHKLPA